MEEIEDPTEKLHEVMHHGMEHGGNSLNSAVALTAAVLAVFAAITSLFSGHYINEAMVKQIKASDQWAYYQAKGTRSTVLTTKIGILEALGKPAVQEDKDKIAQYKSDQDEIAATAKELEESAEKHVSLHLIFAKSVTFFQVAIAIVAVAALSKKRAFWHFGLLLGSGGLALLCYGIFSMYQ